MKVILKSTTNARMLRFVNEELVLYPFEIGQVFVAKMLERPGSIASSAVKSIERIEDTLIVTTSNSEYIFEVTE